MLLSYVIVSAQTVSPEQAAQRARNFFQTKTVSGRKYSAQPLTLSHTATASSSSPLYYVFNRQGGGWAIIGGDEICRQVIAFSDHGTFDYDNMSDNTKAWLRMYEEQIDSAINQRLVTGSKPLVTVTSTALGDDIDPLTNTEWDQDSPFNDLAPQINSTKCPIGCTALTMAQIMKYHQWPVSGVGSHSYYDAGSQQTLSAKFADREYDWSLIVSAFYDYTNMVDPNRVARRSALAQLLYDAAVSVDTQFGADGSSSNLTLVRQALGKYFQYNTSTMKQYIASNFAANDWRNMLYSELSAKRPVIYAAVDSTVGGHAFICDGYKFQDNTHYFSFKWGWKLLDKSSASYTRPDGWFTLDALTPVTFKFSSQQHALIGIQPKVPEKKWEIHIFEPSQYLYPEKRGGHLMLPAHNDAGAPFVGWTNEWINETTTQQPTIIPAEWYTPTADINLYPVFAYTTHNGDSPRVVLEENFSDVNSGDYLVNGRWMGNSNFPCTLPEGNVYAWNSNGMIVLGWQGDASITSRTINVRPGTPFTLAFSTKGNQNEPYDITVNIDGHKFDVSTTATNYDEMDRHSFTFIAQSEAINVKFSIKSSLDQYIFLDSISIVAGGNTQVYTSSRTELSVPLTVTDAKWATFYPPFDVTLEPGVKAYTVSASGSKLVTDLIADGDASNNVIPAHTPVLIKTSSAYTKTYKDKYASTKRPSASTSNLLVGTLPPAATLAPSNDDYINYVLQYRGGWTSWYSVVFNTSTSTYNSLPAFRAYLSTDIASSAVKELFDQLATDIGRINDDENNAEKTYNLQGQPVSDSYRGIVIRNGRKYLK